VKKSTPGCARTLSEVSWLSILSICFTVLRFGVPFIFQLLLSHRNLTSSRRNIGYMQHGLVCGKMCSILNIILKIKNRDFLYLPGMDSTDMK